MLFTTNTHMFFGTLNVTDRQVNLEFVVFCYTWRFLYPGSWFCPECICMCLEHSTIVHIHPPGAPLAHSVKSTTPLLHDITNTDCDNSDGLIEPRFRHQHSFLTMSSDKTSERFYRARPRVTTTWISLWEPPGIKWFIYFHFHFFMI